jgi:hypothetical protein
MGAGLVYARLKDRARLGSPWPCGTICTLFLQHLTSGSAHFCKVSTYNELDYRGRMNRMATKLELEEYLYRRAIEIIESAESDSDKENLLFQEVWCPLADLYKDRITATSPE